MQPGTSRRSFLGSVAAAPVIARRLPSAASGRPNILFLLSDDQRWDALGCMGNRIIQTPNLDRLSSQGVTFTNNFVTTAICMSSRASIFTGLHLRAHGINSFNAPLRPADFERSYPMLMREAGYRTGFIGKWGVGNQMPAARFDYFKGFPGQGVYFPKEGGGKHLTNIMGEQATEFIDGSSEKQPFCLSISFKSRNSRSAFLSASNRRTPKTRTRTSSATIRRWKVCTATSRFRRPKPRRPNISIACLHSCAARRRATTAG
jgi:hypothetical protein